MPSAIVLKTVEYSSFLLLVDIKFEKRVETLKLYLFFLGAGSDVFHVKYSSNLFRRSKFVKINHHLANQFWTYWANVSMPKKLHMWAVGTKRLNPKIFFKLRCQILPNLSYWNFDSWSIKKVPKLSRFRRFNAIFVKHLYPKFSRSRSSCNRFARTLKYLSKKSTCFVKFHPESNKIPSTLKLDFLTTGTS